MMEKVREVTCVKCGAVMRYGFLVGAQFGFNWRPTESGLKALKNVPLMAYACPECGYIEHYVRNIQQDREKILLADTVERN